MNLNDGWKRCLAGAALMGAAACTIVIPPEKKPDPPPVIRIPGDPAPKLKMLEAHALFVMNLHQSSANLAPSYVTLADALIAGLATRGINVVRWAVIPTYPGADGMRLLFGANTTPPTPTSLPIPGAGTGGDSGGLVMGSGGAGGTKSSGPIPAAPQDDQGQAWAAPLPTGGVPADLPPVPTLPNGVDIVTTLQRLAATGKYDGVGTVSEAEGVVRTGNHLVEAHLPADLGGLDGAAFFDRPRNLFMVVYLQPLTRRCSLGTSDCEVDGRSPADIFSETAPDGTASWLHFGTGGMPTGQVVHVAISTKEGEAPDAFRKRCSAVNGFPPNLFDVMEPSSTLYFNPLMAALNAVHDRTGQQGDMCDLLGELGLSDATQRKNLNTLINAIASRAGSAPDTTSTTPTDGLPPPVTP